LKNRRKIDFFLGNFGGICLELSNNGNLRHFLISSILWIFIKKHGKNQRKLSTYFDKIHIFPLVFYGK